MAFFDEKHSSELAQKASADIVSYIAVWNIDLPKLLSNAVSGIYACVSTAPSQLRQQSQLC